MRHTWFEVGKPKKSTIAGHTAFTRYRIPLLPDALFYTSTQNYRACEVGGEIISDVSNFRGFVK